MPVGMGNVRGTEYTSIIRYIRENFGEEGLSKVLKNFSEQEKKTLSGKINPMKWYPVELILRFLAEADKVCGKGDFQLAYLTGRKSAEDTFSGLYEMFLEMGRPETIIMRAPMAWGILHDTGNFELDVAKENYARAKITGFEPANKYHCQHLAGYFEKVLELSGAKKVKIRELSCYCDGDEYCEFEAVWEYDSSS